MLKFVEAVVDVKLPIIEDDGVLDFVVGESFKAVEESIGIRMVLLGVGSVTVVVCLAIEVTSVDNENVEVDLEVVGIALATNVVYFKEIAERVISVEDVFEFVRLDVVAARTDSVLMSESIVCLGAVVCTGESVVIDVAIVACNGGVGKSIAIVDDTTVPTRVAVVVCKAGTLIEISVT